MKKSLLFLTLLLISVWGYAQTYTLSGKTTDKQGNPIGFTSVYIRNSTYGSTANEEGFYQFKLSPGTYDVIYRFVGYVEHIEKVTINSQNTEVNVQLEPEVFKPKQVNVVSRKRGPADTIMKQVIAKRKFYLEEVKGYSCAVYVKGVQKLISAPKKLMGRDVARALELDTSRKGILYQSESLSEFNFQRPDKVKEVMIASRIAGQNTAFSYNKASDLQVNFYNNLFEIEGLSAREFISPIADNAMRYYHYKLAGVSIENGRTIDKIEVIPRREHDPVYRGYIYIIDGEWRLYSVDLKLTKQDNLNLVDTLSISQQYIPIEDNKWLPVSVQYTFNGNVLGFKFDGYYAAIYNNYKINPQFPEHFFTGEVMRIDTAANKKDNSYWDVTRPVPLTAQEARDYHRKDSINVIRQSVEYQDSLENAKNKFLPLPYLVFGYGHTDRHNARSYYVYPFNQTLFYNTVEGWGLNLKTAFTHFYANNQSLTVTPAVRYGFGNKMFNANVHITYSYNPLKQGYWYGTFGTDVLDLSNVGTRSLFFNTLSSLLSENNFVKYYRSKFGLVGYQRELANGILLYAQLSYADREQLYNTSFNHIFDDKNKHYTSNNPLTPDAPETPNSLFPQNQALSLRTSLTFTFDQRYTTRPDGRYLEPSKYPKIRVNYRKGINAFGSDVNYDFGSVDVFDDHVSLGTMGYSAFKVTGGAFFNRKSLYFMDYNHFQGNQGTVFDPTIGSFHFLPFYDYSTSKAFLEAHYEHNFTGSLFGNIPLLRKLKLEEIIGANYLTEQQYHRNYSEFYVGVKRFFFRVDYGFAFNDSHKLINAFRIFYGIK